MPATGQTSGDAVDKAPFLTHLDEETCLEVLIVDGDARRIAQLATRLKTLKGVLSAETVIGSTVAR